MPTPSPLTVRTRELLKHRDRTLTMRKIAADTNLSIRFLESFAYDHSQDYGTNRVTVLYEYLSGKKVQVA